MKRSTKIILSSVTIGMLILTLSQNPSATSPKPTERGPATQNKVPTAAPEPTTTADQTPTSVPKPSPEANRSAPPNDTPAEPSAASNPWLDYDLTSLEDIIDARNVIAQLNDPSLNPKLRKEFGQLLEARVQLLGKKIQQDMATLEDELQRVDAYEWPDLPTEAAAP
jgi:hypothetical protein